jgi:hypothetical protein
MSDSVELILPELPKTITFKNPPFGVVTVQKDQLGYLRKTGIRLRRDKKRDEIFFPVKNGRRYIQDSLDDKKFNLA